MRICMTYFGFYPTTGGVESHLFELCSELVRQGHEVFALVGSRLGSPSREPMGGFTVHRVDWLHLESVRAQKRAAGYSPTVVWPELRDEIREYFRQFIDEHHCDIVHAHNFHQYLPEPALALTQLREDGVPCVLTVHEARCDFLCQELLERSRWDAVIAVSKHVAAGIEWLAPHLENLRVLYMGTDTEMFTPEKGMHNARRWRQRLQLTGPTIMHPARMLPWKGIFYGLEALAMLHREFPDVQLIITDTDDVMDWIDELQGYRQQVHEAIEHLGLRGSVLCRSFDYLDLPAIYANCEAVICPSIGEEAFGLAAVEAMACGKPVIVSNNGGLVESVIDRVTGYVIPRRDSQALADKLAMLLRNPALARRLGRAGRLQADRKFNRHRMAAETACLYANAVAQRPLAAGT